MAIVEVEVPMTNRDEIIRGEAARTDEILDKDDRGKGHAELP